MSLSLMLAVYVCSEAENAESRLTAAPLLPNKLMPDTEPTMMRARLMTYLPLSVLVTASWKLLHVLGRFKLKPLPLEQPVLPTSTLLLGLVHERVYVAEPAVPKFAVVVIAVR